jgi:hypothetical protein
MRTALVVVAVTVALVGVAMASAKVEKTCYTSRSAASGDGLGVYSDSLYAPRDTSESSCDWRIVRR